MLRQKPLLGFLPLAMLGGLVFLGVRECSAPDHHIDWDSFESIHVGMSLEQVEAILGVQPGDYSGGQVEVMLLPGNYESVGSFHALEHSSHSWVGPEYAIFVDPSDRGIVQDCRIYLVQRVEMPMLQRLRRWLGSLVGNQNVGQASRPA
jgi:hypothetical protein